MPTSQFLFQISPGLPGQGRLADGRAGWNRQSVLAVCQLARGLGINPGFLVHARLAKYGHGHDEIHRSRRQEQPDSFRLLAQAFQDVVDHLFRNGLGKKLDGEDASKSIFSGRACFTRLIGLSSGGQRFGID